MNETSRQRRVRLQWLAWFLFWSGFSYLGAMQTWVFNDIGPKPLLADWIEPLHFWFPWVLFFGPLWLLPQHTLLFFAAAAACWLLAVSRLLVFVQDRLFQGLSPRMTWWSLAAIAAILIALWLLAGLPPKDRFQIALVSAASYFLLSALVVGTWLYILIGLGVIAWRGLRRRPPH